MSRHQKLHSSPKKRADIEPLNLLGYGGNSTDYGNSLGSARSLPRAKSAVFTENAVDESHSDRAAAHHQTSVSTGERLDGPPPSASSTHSATMLQKNNAWPTRSSPTGGGALAAPPDSAHSSKDLHPLSDRRRRSSIILNKRLPMRKADSSELGDLTGSKLTLDEELYDILHAFL
uniref:CARMIL_C domain-containing protein n=1 Tax=Globodera pallida TaxID=36090 RepID=A0A183C4W5_GLOPA